MSRTLVIVPCGRSKIWNKEPHRGPTPAADAYIGTPFRLNRRYAETFGDAWVVLSARYGLMWPESTIDGPYEVTFKRPSTNPIPFHRLVEQVRDMGLASFTDVVGLGGADYRKAIETAFAPFETTIRFPFAGLPIGKMMQATKRAIERGRSGFDRDSE